MQRLEVDDTSPVIAFSAGQWTGLTGSSRQWDKTIHSTGVPGAWAAMDFQGARIVVYCTVPIGIGKTVHATVVLDGQTTAVSRLGLANGTAIYGNILFDSGPIADALHSITLTNTGATTDSPLQLDRFHLEGTVFNPTPGKNAAAVPVPAPVLSIHPSTSIQPTLSSTSTPSSSSVSASAPVVTPLPNSSSNSSTVLPASMTITDSNGGTEIVPLPQNFKATATPPEGFPQVTGPGASTLFFSHLVTSTEADGTVVTQIVDSPRTQSSSTSGHIPKAAIVGVIAGALVVLFAAILIIFRLRKRRSNSGHMRLADEKTEGLTGVNPFDIHERSRTSQSSATRTHHHVASEFRDEKRKSMVNQTRDLAVPDLTETPAASTGVSAAAVGVPPAPAPAPDHTPAPQTLPNIMVEFGHGSYMFVPHHQHAASTPSATSPETPSSMYSTVISSTAMLLSTEANDMPPSYQVGV